jgi:hypothetical protein
MYVGRGVRSLSHFTRYLAAFKLGQDEPSLFLGRTHTTLGVHRDGHILNLGRSNSSWELGATRKCHSSHIYDICENLSRGTTRDAYLILEVQSCNRDDQLRISLTSLLGSPRKRETLGRQTYLC